jgi:hypothetical protein
MRLRSIGRERAMTSLLIISAAVALLGAVMAVGSEH